MRKLNKIAQLPSTCFYKVVGSHYCNALTFGHARQPKEKIVDSKNDKLTLQHMQVDMTFMYVS